MRQCKTLPIGIELGEHAVKVAQFVRTREGVRIRDTRAVEVQMDRGASLTQRREKWAVATRRALRIGAFRGRQATCALPLAAVSIRHVRVPEESLGDLGSFLLSELELERRPRGEEFTICPIPVADLLDHGERKREFLCCIAEAADIQGLIETVEACGLTANAIDLETCALVRPFAFGHGERSFVHVDVGSHQTRLCAVRAGKPILMRTAPVSSVEILNALAVRLRIDLRDALALARNSDQDFSMVRSAIIDALWGPLDLLMRGVDDCLRYSGAMFRGQSPPLVRVTGGVAALPGVVEHFHSRLGMRVEVGDPFAAVGEPAETCADGEDWQLGAGTFSTALGLALRGAVA